MSNCSERCFLWWSEHPYDEKNGFICPGCHTVKGEDGLLYKESNLVYLKEKQEDNT